MKKGRVFLLIASLTLILSCRNDSRMIIGKWKLENSSSVQGEMMLTFFSENVFSIVYSAKNETQTRIKNTGVWKWDIESNILELINDKGNTVEKYHIQLLNKDSLIWLEMKEGKTISFNPHLFLKG